MSNYKLFLSHSSKDNVIVNAFVNFMYKIGLTEKDIVCTSMAGTHIPARQDIYEFLNNLLSTEKIYAIFFLSDNYYTSPVCLNEMGAVWLKKSMNLSFLLPGFSFEDIQGVIGNDNVGIKLGGCDSMTKALFNNFKKDLENIFHISIDYTKWEVARDEFLNISIGNTHEFNMAFSRSFCIGDLENDGCKIIKKDSDRRKITARINFDETDSKLCSIVVFMDATDFTYHFINRKNLCFEAYGDSGITNIQIEMGLNNVDMSTDIYLSEDENSYKIPLSQFCDALTPWKKVSEIKFLIHRKKVSAPGDIIIRNLRLE